MDPSETLGNTKEKVDRVRKLVTSKFKLNGLQLRSDATAHLLAALVPTPDRELEAWAEKIVDRILKMKLKSPLVDKSIVEVAVKECGKGDQGDQEDILSLISAFDVPKYTYNADKKKFLPVSATSDPSSILCPANHKALIYRNRYAVLLQRTYHHELFSPTMQSSSSSLESRKKFQLMPVEFLVGSSTKLDGVIVLGMITQLKEGKYYLEDNTGNVELDISSAKFHTGLYTENCFVLAEGNYDDGVLHVNAMGLPPSETALVSKSYHGSTNFFGGPPTVISRERLEAIERQNEGTMFVVLSDVYLDKATVLAKLRILFEGYSETPPVLFILMGNFLSEPHGGQSAVVLRDCFKTLADLLVEFPLLVTQSKFVLVPGPTDPGFVNILPRPPLADCITSYIREKVPSVVFASNPFRIKYCTKNIVIFREDIVTKLCRNSIYFPSSGDIAKEFVSTIVGQAHLCPLPLHICPVYWSFDHVLSLYPLPDLLIIGDKGDPFVETNTGCIFTNPGSFVKTDFSFKVYSPFDNKVEDCQLPQE